MKKVILICLLGLSFAASAQISRNAFLISGSFSFNSTSQQSEVPTTGPAPTYQIDVKSRSIIFTPRVGYFISRSFATGLVMTWESTKMNIEPYTGGSVDQSQRSVGIGPFLRYYLPLSEKILLFANGSMQLNSFKAKGSATYFDGTGGVTVIETTTKHQGKTWTLGAGVTYLVVSAVGVDLDVAYVKSSEEESDQTSKGVQLSVGINLLLNNK